MKRILLKNAVVVNRGTSRTVDILINNDRIEKIDKQISHNSEEIHD